MYEPRAMVLRDGDLFRDIYALGVIIFRVMSCKEVYIQFRTRQDIMSHAKEYVKDKTHDDILTQILNGTVLCKEDEKKLTLFQLADMVSELIK